MKTTIVKTGINGEGIGYIDHTPVFVPGALVNETVEITIVEKAQRFMRAKLDRVLTKSAARVTPACAIQAKCGGCALMIARYEDQLIAKQALLRQSLIKYAQVNPRLIKDIRPSDVQFGYRNQCKLPCAMADGKLATGMYIPNSNYFQAVEYCPIHEPGLEEMRRKILAVLNEFSLTAYDYHQKKGIRSIVLRGFDGAYQACLVSGLDDIPQECINMLMAIDGLKSLWQSIHTVKKTPDMFGAKMIHLAGTRHLHITLDDLTLQCSPRSFFQLNTKQARELYRTIASLVPMKNRLLVEAYSGIGAISLYVRDRAEEIIGIESVKDAVVNANANARSHHAENVSFLCADAADKLIYLSKQRSIDTLIVDPPRTGLDEPMLYAICKSKIKNVLYVSCNPATLGKNLSVLTDHYEIEQIIPFDMFPNTPLIESVTVLRYKGSKKQKRNIDGAYRTYHSQLSNHRPKRSSSKITK